MITEKIKDALKKLPGVSIVLAAMTYLGARFMGVEELEGVPLVVAYGICAVGYWIGSKLDKPIYDRLYGPKSQLQWLPVHSALQSARKSAFDTLFKPRGVQSYVEAEQCGMITEKKGIYSEAKRAAVAANRWDGFIVYIHDWSKAARSLFCISVIFLLLALIATYAPNVVPSSLASSIDRLGIWGSWVVYAVLVPIFFVLYMLLRAFHQVRLYSYVSDKAKLLQAPDGSFVPVILE